MKTKSGTENDDIIEGGGAAEKILGLGGNDTITGGGGDDRIWCGNNAIDSKPGEWDDVDGGGGNDLIYGEGGGDYLAGGTGADRLFGGDGDDFLFGGNGNDRINGDAGDDIIGGDKGADFLFGGDGDDLLMAMLGNDQMDGGKGNDIYRMGMDKARATDKSGNDEYHIENTLADGDGSAFIFDRTGKDTLVFDDFVKDDLIFTREGFDLLIEIDGFRGETTLSGFYLNRNNRIETLIDDSDNDYALSVLNVLVSSGDSREGSELW